MFNIIEKFISIDGEGPTAGELAVFIRFQGCNLRCSWCDTVYSFESENITETLSGIQIYEYIKSTKVKNVTLTGGEPLIQHGICDLLELLNNDLELKVHIETNGSIDIEPFKTKYKNISFIVDYKLPKSDMTHTMNENNLSCVDKNDVYKFVVASISDLEGANDIIKKYNLDLKTNVYLSPVFGSIVLSDIVDFMKDNLLNNVVFQVQLHKIVWDENERGV